MSAIFIEPNDRLSNLQLDYCLWFEYDKLNQVPDRDEHTEVQISNHFPFSRDMELSDNRLLFYLVLFENVCHFVEMTIDLTQI